jgi:hypothetical protein
VQFYDYYLNLYQDASAVIANIATIAVMTSAVTSIFCHFFITERSFQGVIESYGILYVSINSLILWDILVLVCGNGDGMLRTIK